jgi:hypothetical protein
MKLLIFLIEEHSFSTFLHRKSNILILLEYLKNLSKSEYLKYIGDFKVMRISHNCPFFMNSNTLSNLIIYLTYKL